MIKIIILKKNNLGNFGDIVNVKLGYARNYLIPYNKAIYATKININKINKKKIFLSEFKKNKEIKYDYIYKKISLLSPLRLYYRCSKNGKLFNSLKSIDIYKILLSKVKYNFSKKSIVLPNGPIKKIGSHKINIVLYRKKNFSFIIDIISIK